MPCGQQSPSCSALPVTRRLSGVDRIPEQEAESALVLLVLGEFGYGGAHRGGALLHPLAEFAVGHDVELVVQYPLQHALPNLFLRAEQVEEIRVLLAALVGLGVTAVCERRRAGPAGLGDVRLHRSRAEARADDA